MTTTPTSQRAKQAQRAERRMRHAGETLALLDRLIPLGRRDDFVRLHRLHARHERELGRPDVAALADARAERLAAR